MSNPGTQQSSQTSGGNNSFEDRNLFKLLVFLLLLSGMILVSVVVVYGNIKSLRKTKKIKEEDNVKDQGGFEKNIEQIPGENKSKPRESNKPEQDTDEYKKDRQGDNDTNEIEREGQEEYVTKEKQDEGTEYEEQEAKFNEEEKIKKMEKEGIKSQVAILHQVVKLKNNKTQKDKNGKNMQVSVEKKSDLLLEHGKEGEIYNGAENAKIKAANENENANIELSVEEKIDIPKNMEDEDFIEILKSVVGEQLNEIKSLKQYERKDIANVNATKQTVDNISEQGTKEQTT
ncbi:hypothetical protein CWI38_1550p0020 [Hamiltosporidium tvaerminnensis]|uniref:Uncharacterized protein n=1 Tax=Hamiltosporidium tvaerminnensis TaxID=1176355 RepID=A0A4Q9LQN9_9MICR|nr:hypothetical protein CWI38_1550p0020 [Hamiltosporidium tvaerminnensis]